MFRTTLSPLLTKKDIEAIAKLVKGAKTFQLQQFVPNAKRQGSRAERGDLHQYSNSKKIVHLPYKERQAKEFANILAKYVGEVLIRGF
jgi:hypothetical protein